MVQEIVDRPGRVSWRGPTTDKVKNAKALETKLGEIALSGIKAELFSMEERWYNPRGKGVGGRVCMGRGSTVPT